MLNNSTLQDQQNYKNLLATISAKDFCEALNELRAIETNSHSRTKKRAMRTILESLDKLDKLGFKISITPKNQGSL